MSSVSTFCDNGTGGSEAVQQILIAHVLHTRFVVHKLHSSCDMCVVECMFTGSMWACGVQKLQCCRRLRTRALHGLMFMCDIQLCDTHEALCVLLVGQKHEHQCNRF